MFLELGDCRFRFADAHGGVMTFAAAVGDSFRDYKNGGLVGDRRIQRIDPEDVLIATSLEDCVSDFSCGCVFHLISCIIHETQRYG